MFFKAERSSQWKQITSLLSWAIQLKIFYTDFGFFFSLAKLSQIPAENSQKNGFRFPKTRNLKSVPLTWSSIIITNIIRVQ